MKNVSDGREETISAGWFIHWHGEHGFVSDGVRYQTVRAAETAARKALWINGRLLGATLHSGGQVIQVERR